MKLTRKQIMLVLAIFGSLVVLYLVSYRLIPQVIVTFTKAAPATTVSVSDSYVIGEKILCRPGDSDKCRVNVFLLDKNGKPVAGKSVLMTGEATIDSLNMLSDKDGKISFEISSESEGQAKLEASYQGVPIGSNITITFREER